MKTFKTISACWYARPQTLKDSVIQLLNFLPKIREYNSDDFGVWYKKGMSRKEALQTIVKMDYQSIRALFDEKYTNDDGYPETTYYADMWNGKDDKNSSALRISLGGKQTRGYTNNCVISLPTRGGARQEFYDRKENQDTLITLMKEYWQPEWIQVDNEVVFGKKK